MSELEDSVRSLMKRTIFPSVASSTKFVEEECPRHDNCSPCKYASESCKALKDERPLQNSSELEKNEEIFYTPFFFFVSHMEIPLKTGYCNDI